MNQYNIKLWLIVVGLFVTMLPLTANAANVDANIGGTETFEGSGNKTFRVNSNNDLKLERFITVQGDIQVTWSAGVKGSSGGKVTIGSVNSQNGEELYHAWGEIIPEAAGGAGGTGEIPEWDAKYNRGSSGRILLRVNGDGEEDDKILIGPEGGKLYVYVVEGSPSVTYTINLHSTGDGSMPGVTFSDGSPNVKSGQTKIIKLEGKVTGTFTISASEVSDSLEAANDDNGRSVSVEVIDFTVEIVKQGANTALIEDQSTIVGLKQKLRGKTTPSLPGIERKWTIEGDPIYSYKFLTVEGKVTKLTENYRGSNLVNFYWTKGHHDGTRNEVKYEVEVYGAVRSATVDYLVYSPNATLKSETTSADPPVGIRDGILVFGKVGSLGIQWTAEVTPTPGGTGHIAYLQTTDFLVRTTDGGNITRKATSDGKYVIDNKNSNAASPLYYENAVPVNANQEKKYTHGDAPNVSAPVDYKFVSIDHKFNLYLMYKPAGTDSIWVCLDNIVWNCKGSASKAGGTWAMDPGQASSVNPGSSGSRELPEWKGKAMPRKLVVE